MPGWLPAAGFAETEGGTHQNRARYPFTRKGILLASVRINSSIEKRLHEWILILGSARNGENAFWVGTCIMRGGGHRFSLSFRVDTGSRLAINQHAAY